MTGVAGFIGSHLLEELLLRGARVTGLDNFSTGSQANLDDVRERVGKQWSNFRLVSGDIRSVETCRDAVGDADVVLHQAALNSVPRSLGDPLTVAEVNVMGTVNLLHAAAASGVSQFVYASSSSVYGDVTDSRRVESVVGRPLSPYAASKQAGEAFAASFYQFTGMSITGLRYFNVFGSRQNPLGPYSAVIPRWVRMLVDGQVPVIYGTGEQSRDFTHVSNIVLANLLAAARTGGEARVFNVGTGHPTSLRSLLRVLQAQVADAMGRPEIADVEARYEPPRRGDVHSAIASLDESRAGLGYEPATGFEQGLQQTVEWFVGKPHLSLL